MNPSSQSDPRRIASAIKERWAQGEAPDAQAALAGHPDLLGEKSAVIDLAYEEWCRRRDAGQPPDPEEFCARFSGYQSSLRNLLLADQFLAASPNRLDEVSPPPWPEPGTRFGSFALLRELGRGAFARVYLATEFTAGGRPVALKLSRQRGGDEVDKLARLDHDHIVPVLWAGTDPGSGLHMVCMPFMGSATLNDVLDFAFPRAGDPPPRKARAILEAVRRTAQPGDPLPDRRPPGPGLEHGSYAQGVLRLAVDLAEALAFLHRSNLYHRDLKPSNVLLTPSGRPLLLDFNLSALAGVAAGGMGGTMPYMAPEHVRAFLEERPEGEPGAPADLFSLGVILYELLTGVHPFAIPGSEGAQPNRELGVRLLERHRGGCRPVRSLNRAVSPELAGLVERCLAFDPGQRPAGAAALAAQLRRLAVGRPSRWKLALAGLTVAAGIGWAVSPPPEPRPPAAAAPAFNARGALAVASGDLDGADRQFRLAVWADPTGWEGYHGQARVQLRRGHLARLAGNTARAAGHYGEADKLFQEAIKARGPWQAHYGRGRALLHLAACRPRLLAPAAYRAAARSGFNDAYRLYEKERAARKAAGANNLGPAEDGATLACLAYCDSHAVRHGDAIVLGKRALKAGFTSPGVLHNLGYSCLKTGKLEQARRYLDGALRDLPAGHPHAAILRLTRLQLALGESLLAPPRGQPRRRLSPSGIEEVEAVLPLWSRQPSPVPTDFYRQAADLYACALAERLAEDRALAVAGSLSAGGLPATLLLAERQPERERLIQRALECLGRAHERGRALEDLARSHAVKTALGSRLDIQKLKKDHPFAKVAPARLPEPAFLLDPIPEVLD